MHDPKTSVRVESVGGVARATLLEGGAYLRPRLLRSEGPYIRIALVGTYAALLAGDEIAISVDVAPGVNLELVEPTGLVAYDAKGAPSRWAASLRVASAASLIWRASPFVVADGANVTRRTDINLERGGVALVGETLVLGRTDEQGGQLLASQHATLDGHDLLVEELDLRSAELRATPGVLGDARVVATMTLLGTDGPEPRDCHETRLAGPGALARAITHYAHEATSALDATWQHWRRDVHGSVSTERGQPETSHSQPAPAE